MPDRGFIERGDAPPDKGECEMTDHASVIARLEALAAAPKPWLVTIHCDNGTTRTLRQPRREMAIAHAERMSTKRGFVRATVEHSPE